MKRLTAMFVLLAVATFLSASSARAYGGGGGARSSCAKPYFTDEKPAQNAEVNSLSEVSFVASDNTATQTLAVKINGNPAQLTVTLQAGGRFAVVAKLPQPVTQAGKVHVGIYGKSRDGCDNQLVYFVTVKPAH
jgi:hypothetical protein